MDFHLIIQAIVVLLICGLLIAAVKIIPGLPSPILSAVTVLLILAFILWLLNHMHIIG